MSLIIRDTPCKSHRDSNLPRAIAIAAAMTFEEVPVTMSFLYSFFWLPGGIYLGAILPSQESHHKLIEYL